MQRKPDFGKTTFYFIEEMVPKGGYPVWMQDWSYETTEDLESWMETVDSNLSKEEKPEFKIDKLVMQNREYNKKHIYGCPFDDSSSIIVNEDCPKCGHLMIRQEDKGKFCSNWDCAYINDELIRWQKYDKERWDKIRNKPPSSKLREAGQTLEQFAKKYKFVLLNHKDKTCALCNQPLRVSDFYRTKEYAAIEYNDGHAEGCNNGPCIMIPLGKEAEKWADIIDVLHNTLGDEPPKGA